jgi:hypothetical protein
MQPLFEAYCGGAQAPLAALLTELAATHRRVVVLHHLRVLLLGQQRQGERGRGEAWRRTTSDGALTGYRRAGRDASDSR